jgi:hypothetical protein
MLELTEKEIVDLECIFKAKKYVETEYFLVGERVYLWDEWGYPEDDYSAYTASGLCPPSDRDYSWYEITDYEINSINIKERTITEKPLTVTIHATVTINSGCSEEDEEEIPHTEEHEIFCYIGFDSETKAWYVEDAEE